ncbi:NAD(P)H-binding protein [Saccharopolyspora taberi]|uniref:NAD(P)H-binding protein n=1 Tax=Saccharopolyspora taberi TaxID=60895 RepID=A0ABN3V8J1_9PSEU
MTNKTILVLGGTGKTGRRVVSRLAERGVEARAASRKGAVRFDWDDETTWAPALEGADAAYLIPPTELGSGELFSTFVARAEQAGVRRFVLLSAREVDESPSTGVQAAEAAVRASGAEWTIVRATWFAQNFSEDFFAPSIESGVLALPTGDGKEPFIDVDDIADVVVAVLLEDGHHGQVYELSGPELLSFAEAVALISEQSGKDVVFQPVEPAEFTRALIADGFPDDLADLFAGLLALIRNGGNAYLSDGVQRVLGRPPRRFADYVRRTWG